MMCLTTRRQTYSQSTVRLTAEGTPQGMLSLRSYHMQMGRRGLYCLSCTPAIASMRFEAT